MESQLKILAQEFSAELFCVGNRELPGSANKNKVSDQTGEMHQWNQAKQEVKTESMDEKFILFTLLEGRKDYKRNRTLAPHFHRMNPHGEHSAQAFAFLASYSHGRFNLEFLLPWNPEHRVIWASNQLFWDFLAFHGQMFVKMVSLGGDVSKSASSYPSTRNSAEREGLTHENKGFRRLKIILLLYIRPSLHHMNTGHATSSSFFLNLWIKKQITRLTAGGCCLFNAFVVLF